MTLQEHYNAIKNGQGNKAQFIKQARNLFPEYFNQYSNYDNAVSTLKSKQIISEAAGGVVSKGFDIWDWKKILAEETKSVEKETSKEVKDKQAHAFQPSDMKNADNINFNEIMKGFYAEMKDSENAKKTGDEIKAMVVKNLAKDPLYYTKNGMFGEKGVGYTDEAPGLGTNTQPKSKESTVLGGNDKIDSDSDIVKNSLVGSAKKNVQDSLGNSEAKTSMPKKVKEMPDKGVSGVEKRIKLKEYSVYQGDVSKIKPEPTPKDGEVYLKDLKAGDKFSIGKLEYIVVKPETNNSGVEVTYADGTGNMSFRGLAVVRLKEGKIPVENRNTYYYVSLAKDMKKDGKSKEEIKQFFKDEEVNDELVDNILANLFMGVKENKETSDEKIARLKEGYDSKAGLSKTEQDKISALSKEEKKALYDDLKDAMSKVNDQDFKDKASYAKAMKDAKTEVYNKHKIKALTEEIKWKRQSLNENVYIDLASAMAALGGATAISSEIKQKLKDAAKKGKDELTKLVNQLKGAKTESSSNMEEELNEASIEISVLNDDFSKDIYVDKNNKVYISPKLAQSLDSSFFSRGPSSYERTKSNLDKAKSAYIKIDPSFRSILRKGLKGANTTELPKKNSEDTFKWISLSFPEKDYDVKITDKKITINKKQPIEEQKLRSLIQQIIKEELNENESQVKKGDVIYHKNSDSTLEVIDISPKEIKMKVTKISDKTPSYIKVGQISKTGPTAIGKTYIKK
jgi:hypothetical protein